MGLPHTVDEENIIDGFRVPKEAILLPAGWWFTRDESVYHNLERFKPERFFEPYNEPYATNSTLGFGRRIGPGRSLANSSLFLTFAQSLTVFEVQKAVDGKENVIEPKHMFGSGIISHPGEFEVGVAPLSHGRASLIDKVVEE